ncbi:hypothetical protein [Iningainema tapete]|uniref:Secreted protein n=1 Tax=Iningainema tapete BLCC-T55 TaxID=2748662 RepID=A0A8J6XM57_9CYAN|nr:hypothetical protein [Iningainema tapete]MBD2777413.1 hypothetical protein [Iningainema tapete BLCC-T55]
MINIKTLSTQRFLIPTKRQITTPQLLKAGLYVTWGASLLLALATLTGVQKQRHAIQTVGKDSAPSILLAQRLKDSLLGMDANAVNELLVKPGQNPRAIEDYEERRRAFSDRIIAAAQNITYGDAERKPIETMQLGLGEYIAKIQRARDFNERGDTQGVVSAYREAAEIMDKKLLPAADALELVNWKQLEIIYNEQRFATAQALFFVITSSLLLLSILFVIQLFLNYRMRRILNPMLLAGTVILLVFLGYTTKALLSSSHNLKVAKEDAFASLYMLREARALAYGINADESRYLIDKEFAAKHEQAFFDKAAKIAKLSNGQTFETVVATFKQTNQVNGFSGLMANVLNNISFPGEKEVALATLSNFGTYLTINQQIRQLEQSGKHTEAIALSTGYNKGESNWAFDQFKKEHTKAQDINKEAFEKAVAQGFKDVEGFEIVAPVVAVAISLLTLFGLLPRIKEYDV